MEYSFISITGPVREENQDSVFVKQMGSNFFSLVCDGMGGHWGGKFASKISVEVFKEMISLQYADYLKNNTLLEDEVYALTLVKNTIHQIVKRMKKFAAGDLKKADMGTTFSLLIINLHIKKAMLVNIGDSRCYKITNDYFLQQLLPDQNVFNYLKKMNYSIEEIQQSPHNLRALTSSLGIRKSVKVDYRFFKIEQTRYLFQATDGLYDFIDYQQLPNIFKKSINTDIKLEGLVQMALKNRSNDNLTGVLIKL